MAATVGHDEAIAVIGMSCRLPQAPSVDAFWQLLRDGVSAVTEVPADRWDADALFDEDVASPGRINTRWGGFVDHVDRFDPAFFGISPREAAAMDPQQRLMLELAWEGLEDAGIVPGALAGSRTAVFVGAIADDYATLVAQHGAAAITQHTLTGLHRGIIANRVSYTLGLRGPSMTVDSAQSSSLVAVHMACESLRRGEAQLALAGGVNLNIVPESTIGAAKFGGLSPDGRCFVLDARANGYVRGEGGGSVVLKALSRALADGDSIHCVIRASAVNNDGFSDGLTVPSGAAQEDVLREAYERAGVDPTDVQYVELHGTGTRVGDPIEAAALGAVLGADRPAGSPLLVGSAKTNVGHLEGAAGIVGLLKAALCIRHRELVPSLNFEQPNPQIELDELRLSVPCEARSWPRTELLAGVSSFGMGGTNCHVVLAEPPASDAAPGAQRSAAGDERAAITDVVPCVVAGADAAALRAQAERLRARVERDGGCDLSDLGFSLATSRSAFEHRAVVVASDLERLVLGLDAVSRGAPATNVIEGASVAAPGETVFVFPGQGSQWDGMAVELLDSSQVFRDAIAACAQALDPFVDWSLVDVLRGLPGAPTYARVDVVQPVLFAVMVSLAALWRSFGVRPAAVVGHSQGEIAAACVAGALSLPDAARIVALRSQALPDLVGKGGMASILLPADDVRQRLGRWPGLLSIAAINSPAATVVSGEPAALDELVAGFEAEGAQARRIPVDYASHSPQIEQIRDRLLDALSQITPQPCDTAFYSTVAGGILDTAELDPEYWYRNLRQPVQFEQATRALHADGHGVFVEMSPHPVLTVGVQVTLQDAAGVVAVGSLRRDEGGWQRMLRSLAEVSVRGVTVDWPAFFAGRDARRIALPTYAFQRRRCWLDGPTAPASADGAPALPGAGRPAAESAEDGGSQDAGASLAQRLAQLAPAEQSRMLLDVVRSNAAVILGYDSADAIDAERGFKAMGFGSLTSVELRNRLTVATGLRLATTLLFSYPTPAALVDHLRDELLGTRSAGAVGATKALDVEPLAIVGMSCRFPGGVRTPEDLWQLVADGVDAISGFPTGRGWDVEERPGGSFVQRGGFLHDADEFDPAFFGISPREALAIDPQQRLLLELAWEVLERAGIVPASLRGTSTGVFVGAMAQDYGPRLHEAADAIGGYLLTGTSASVASGRIAYTLGLEGPAMTVDTACSSSLVAVHLACRAIADGDCSFAIAGGATVMATPGMFHEFGRQSGLSADGRCKSFAAAADGTSWAEGAGLLALERLSDARRNGRRVLAILPGSAVNQDGASHGLTAPNGAAQQRVIASALTRAGLSAAEIDAVEAHGTGTALGDPIEADAIIATYGRDRPADRPLWLGSLKSNIGHAQAAAGVAGVIKMVEALRHGELPRTLHAGEPTPHVDWSAGAVSLLTEPQPWRHNGRARRAGVSSFGISGTNAHVLVEEAPASTGNTADPADQAGPVTVPWVISAKSEVALRSQAERLSSHLRARPDAAPVAVGHALATTRTHHAHRAAFVADEVEQLLDQLDRFARGDGHARSGVARAGRIAFVFPGSRSQWAGMARGLLDASAIFGEHVQACAQALDPLTGWSLLDVLRDAAQAPSLERADVVEPALFATMTALAALWRSYGIGPDTVVGDAAGEVAAAYVAGALSLHDAARIVAARSRTLTATFGEGSTPAAEQEFLAALDDIAPRAPQVELYSTRTGELVGAGDLGPAHWYRSPLEQSSYEQVAAALLERDHSLFVEVSPDPVLVDATARVIRRSAIAAEAVGTLLRDEGGPARVLAAVAHAHVCGASPDWDAVFAGHRAAPIELPTYAFERESYWLRPAPAADVTAAGLERGDHPLLGAGVDLPDGQLVHSGRICLATHPWLADHAIAGVPVLAGAALVDLVLWAARRTATQEIEELTLQSPLVVPEHDAVALQIHIAVADEDGARPVSVHSRPLTGDAGVKWICHARGRLTAERTADGAGLGETWPPDGCSELDLTGLYDRLAAVGYQYGPLFQGLRSVWQDGEHVFAEIALPEDGQLALAPADRFALHPAALDAALHALLARMLDDEDGGELLLPFAWGGVRLHATGATGMRVRLTRTGPQSASLLVADGAGAPLAAIGSLALRPLAEQTLAPADSARTTDLYQIDWTVLQTGAEAQGVWSVLGDDAQLTAALIAAFVDARPCRDLAALRAAPDALGEVVLALAPDAAADPHETACEVLRLLQEWLAEDAFAQSRLVLVTRGAVATHAAEPLRGLGGAAVWGLVRSAQSENPGRFTLLDYDDRPASRETLATAVASGEPQIALREGAALVPRLASYDDTTALSPPEGRAWRVDITGAGTVDGLAIVDNPAADRPLEPGEVRVAVRAAGVNFKDVVLALGMVEDRGQIGLEGAGVVVAVAPDVTDLAPGDRVMGMFAGSFAPLAVADRRMVTAIPAGWTFADAASVPAAFLTAYYALADVAALLPGERLLVHSAAGGVGMAAVQLASHWGAEVYGTASPPKWDALRALGIDDGHISNSRTLDFEQQILAATGGEGVDVVLDSFAREFVDASLRLLPRGGRFVEMGKTDVRDPGQVAAEHPGVAYEAFDLHAAAGAVRIGEMLADLTALFEQGALTPLPSTSFDVRRAPEALRHISQARHTGKVVLSVPVAPDPEGTVLVTGGTGALGAIVARRLVSAHGVRRLLLTSRRGPAAEGAAELVAELESLGAAVRIAACDVADRDALSGLLSAIPPAHPLTAVIHAAGVLDDGVIESLGAEQLRRVLQPKVDAGRHLDELTAGLDLAAFVAFSSVAGTLGTPGQGNYAAANACLDGLAHQRRVRGLPVTSLAWGLWASPDGMAGGLDEDDVQRMARSGLAALPVEQALSLFDAALTLDRAVVVPARLDGSALGDRDSVLPALLASLHSSDSGRPAQPACEPASTALREQLAGLSAPEQRRMVLELVRAHAAAVLGRGASDTLPDGQAFKELGFDSLTAIELRNRLGTATGVRLPATLVFDYPTPALLAEQVRAEMLPAGTAATTDAAAAEPYRERDEIEAEHVSVEDQLADATPDALFDFIEHQLGVSGR
jgi:acyl transferase domain-containing protein/NADPH:quinone reductase-like Zn-dependent oxidoreductase